MIVNRNPNFIVKTLEGSTICIEDEFIKRTPIPGDGAIKIKVDWSTYGEVASWLAAYDKDDMGKITKDNFEEFNDGQFFECEENMIRNGGLWLSTLYGTGEKFDALDHNRKLPPDTPFTKIVAKGCKAKWDEEVRVISIYTGRQGLLTITVFDKATGQCMFSWACLELFLNYRSK